MTRDFFDDASQVLHEAGQPHLLLCGWEAGAMQFRSHRIRSLDQLEWFRENLLDWLQDIESELVDRGLEGD